MANPDRPNAATIIAAALADGAGDFLRDALPKGEAAPFLSEVVRALDEHIERTHLAAEQRERERLVAEQREREQRERERLALDQRSPILSPGGDARVRTQTPSRAGVLRRCQGGPGGRHSTRRATVACGETVA